MHYADSIGLKKIAERLSEYADRFNEPALKPAALLQQLAREGRGFADWQAAAKAA